MVSNRLLRVSAQVAWGLVGVCLMATSAAAQPSEAACDVFASGQLLSPDYVMSYQGPCQNGQAQGQGTARWTLRYAPQAPAVVWQGRFDRSVFLEHAAVQSARPLDRSRVLLGLGALKGPDGQTGQLWVESRVQNAKQTPQLCQPVSLQITTQGALNDDAVAKSWLQAGMRAWRGHCTTADGAFRTRQIRVQLHEAGDLVADDFGNLPAALVHAVLPLQEGDESKPSAWGQYVNRVAQQQAQLEAQHAHEQNLKDNQHRLLGLVQSWGVQRYVPLKALDQNPFRYGDEVLLLAVHLSEVLSPEQAVVQQAMASRHGGWTWVLAHGDVAHWDEGGRMLAVRVKGRKPSSPHQGWVEVQVLHSRACAQPDCSDHLHLPGPRWLTEGLLPLNQAI